MGVFKCIGIAMKAIGRLLGLGAAPAATSASVSAAEPARTIAVPAVASFVMRAHIDRFFLASRLASVARLNTPHGRKPRLQAKRSELPPIPAARLGARKTRLDANRGPRVLTAATTAPVKPNNVIPFPVRAAAAAQHAARLARAA